MSDNKCYACGTSCGNPYDYTNFTAYFCNQDCQLTFHETMSLALGEYGPLCENDDDSYGNGKDKIVVLLDKEDHVKGFMDVGDKPSKHLKEFVIEVPYSITSVHHTKLEFYKWRGLIYYLHTPKGFDVLSTVYDQYGNRQGSPSGGLDGKGDGMVFDMSEPLGEIIID